MPGSPEAAGSDFEENRRKIAATLGNIAQTQSRRLQESPQASTQTYVKSPDRDGWEVKPEFTANPFPDFSLPANAPILSDKVEKKTSDQRWVAPKLQFPQTGSACSVDTSCFTEESPRSDLEDAPSPLFGPGTTQYETVPDNYSVASDGGIPQLRAASAKDRLTSYTADAKLAAQVLRVKTGVDGTIQAIKDSRRLNSLFSKVGLAKKSAANSTACEPPECTDSEVLSLFQEEPALRKRISSFHEIQFHLDSLLPALQDYQRHRIGLANAEQRLGIALQELGIRQAGSLGEALQGCGNVHRQAAAKRVEAHMEEEKHTCSSLSMHCNQAATDCKRAIQAYEAARKELRLLCEAEQRTREKKQEMQDSGVNRVDSKLGPIAQAAVASGVEQAKERLNTTRENVTAKLLMLEAKYKLDYATSVTYHMRTVLQEEMSIAEIFAGIGDALATVQESAAILHLKPEDEMSDRLAVARFAKSTTL